MTLRQLNTLLREDEIENLQTARTRLVGIIAILRSAHQHDLATNEGITASCQKFVKEFGPINTENVDKFMIMPDALLDLEIDNDYIIEILVAD